MAPNDQTYFTARATEERAMASRADDHRASVIHRTLANGFDMLARNAATKSNKNGVVSREEALAER